MREEIRNHSTCTPFINQRYYVHCHNHCPPNLAIKCRLSNKERTHYDKYVAQSCCRTHTLHYEWSVKSCRDNQNILDVCLSVRRCICVEKKSQLDDTGALLHLWYAQQVSGTSMPINRSSRLYVCYCRLWCAVLGLWLSGGQVQGSRVCVQEEGCCTTDLLPCTWPRQPAAKNCTP